jgi:broad specificity phosphatase PhoE
METAGLLGLKDAKWYCEFYLRELDKGILAGKSKKERKERLSAELDRKALDPFFYAAPGGESVADCCIRVEKVLDILRRTCPGLRVAIVCHGNIMKAFRVRMERMSQSEYYKNFIDPATSTNYKIRNCQIIWYSRRNPITNHVSSKYRWVRSVCPWDAHSVAQADWEEISRVSYTNEELLSAVQNVQQLVNYHPGETYPDHGGGASGESPVPYDQAPDSFQMGKGVVPPDSREGERGAKRAKTGDPSASSPPLRLESMQGMARRGVVERDDGEESEEGHEEP